MFTFFYVLHDTKQKKHKQTLETAQYGLEFSFIVFMTISKLAVVVIQ